MIAVFWQRTEQQHLYLVSLHHAVLLQLVFNLLVSLLSLLILGTHAAAHLEGLCVVSITVCRRWRWPGCNERNASRRLRKNTTRLVSKRRTGRASSGTWGRQGRRRNWGKSESENQRAERKVRNQEGQIALDSSMVEEATGFNGKTRAEVVTKIESGVQQGSREMSGYRPCRATAGRV